MNNVQGQLILPERFVGAKLSNIKNPDLVNLIKNYVDNFSKYNQSGIAPGFFGKAGSGKTYAAAVLAKHLVANGVFVFWAPTISVLNKLMDYRDFRSEHYFQYKNKLLTTQVVVFDDFGQLEDFARIKELFFEIIDYRYSNNLSTIFTANFTIDSPSSWNQVSKCFNNSLARRVEQMTKGLLFNFSPLVF